MFSTGSRAATIVILTDCDAPPSAIKLCDELTRRVGSPPRCSAVGLVTQRRAGGGGCRGGCARRPRCNRCQFHQLALASGTKSSRWRRLGGVRRGRPQPPPRPTPAAPTPRAIPTPQGRRREIGHHDRGGRRGRDEGVAGKSHGPRRGRASRRAGTTQRGPLAAPRPLQPSGPPPAGPEARTTCATGNLHRGARRDHQHSAQREATRVDASGSQSRVVRHLRRLHSPPTRHRHWGSATPTQRKTGVQPPVRILAATHPAARLGGSLRSKTAWGRLPASLRLASGQPQAKG